MEELKEPISLHEAILSFSEATRRSFAEMILAAEFRRASSWQVGLRMGRRDR